ncbi:MAG: hypothetical protein HUK24_01840 [Sphaerochaetaceae bacterium]|nr:hypothetical protein [Sphaerochaetaceae bacterium]
MRRILIFVGIIRAYYQSLFSLGYFKFAFPIKLCSGARIQRRKNGKIIFGKHVSINYNAHIAATENAVLEVGDYSDIGDNNVIIAYDTQSMSDEQMVKIGYTKNSLGDFENTYYHAESASSLINDLVDKLSSGITSALSPHYERQIFTLMKNSPKSSKVEDAYKMVNKGYYQAACQVFENEYKRHGHVPSGYNAAILYYVLGDYEKALSLSEAVYDKSGNPKVLTLYYKMLEVMNAQEAAKAQISSTDKKVMDNNSELIGF